MKNSGIGKSKTAKESFDPRNARDELNMAEFPLAVLGDQVPVGQTTIEFTEEVLDPESGKILLQRVAVTSSSEYGLPTSKDEDVLLALLQVTRLTNDFTNPEVAFAKREIIEILGWKKTGWSYNRIEESLHRWKDVNIHYFNAWRDKAIKKPRDSEATGVIRYFKFVHGSVSNDNKNAPGPHERSRFIWDDMFFESFRAGYLKKLDFETYRKLRRPAARRAYRFLDKRFWHRPDWQFPLRTFACERVGFSREYDTGQLKARLQPALEELEAVGMIEPATYTKERAGQWRIDIQQKRIEKKTEIRSAELDETELMLVSRQVSSKMAKRLARGFSADQIARNVQFFDKLKGQNDSRVSKNPPGFLVTAIREDIAGKQPPARPSTPIVENSQARHKQQPELVADAYAGRRVQIDAYWNSLDDSERKNAETAAFKSATRFLLEGFERANAIGQPEMVKVYRQAILDQYLVDTVPQLLAEKTAA
jgi:Replication initiator protein A